MTGLVNLRRSLRLSPLDPPNFNTFAGLAAARASAGDWADAVTYFERALQERPRAHWIRRALTACLMGAGRADEARAMADKLLKGQPDFTITRYLDASPLRPSVKAKFAEFLRATGLPE